VADLGGGTTPRWRRDGREIIYLSREGLVSVPMTLSANSVSLGKPATMFAPSGPRGLGAGFFTRTRGYAAGKPRFVVHHPPELD